MAAAEDPVAEDSSPDDGAGVRARPTDELAIRMGRRSVDNRIGAFCSRKEQGSGKSCYERDAWRGGRFQMKTIEALICRRLEALIEMCNKIRFFEGRYA